MKTKLILLLDSPSVDWLWVIILNAESTLCSIQELWLAWMRIYSEVVFLQIYPFIFLGRGRSGFVEYDFHKALEVAEKVMARRKSNWGHKINQSCVIFLTLRHISEAKTDKISECLRWHKLWQSLGSTKLQSLLMAIWHFDQLWHLKTNFWIWQI